ncbi:MAG: hypothetical protein GY737_00150 [Desulfobacteraceae bacterium]|nr:hypothetical protein [Desulfobacteraceae bacterium]
MPNAPTILVIGDSHDNPETPGDRYDWAAAAIIDTKPEVVVDMGDFATCGSLSKFEKRGSRVMEGQRFSLDAAHARDSRKRLTRLIGKSKTYNPRLIALQGNHEYRIERAIEEDPTALEGFLSAECLGAEDSGWEVYPYLKPVEVEGVWFCHHAVNKMGKAPGGKYQANMGLDFAMSSFVCGHNHELQRQRKVYQGRVAISMTAGCYFTHREHWATEQQQEQWEAGLLWLHGVKDGDFGHEWVPIGEVERLYG